MTWHVSDASFLQFVVVFRRGIASLLTSSLFQARSDQLIVYLLVQDSLFDLLFIATVVEKNPEAILKMAMPTIY